VTGAGGSLEIVSDGIEEAGEGVRSALEWAEAKAMAADGVTKNEIARRLGSNIRFLLTLVGGLLAFAAVRVLYPDVGPRGRRAARGTRACRRRRARGPPLVADHSRRAHPPGSRSAVPRGVCVMSAATTTGYLSVDLSACSDRGRTAALSYQAVVPTQGWSAPRALKAKRG